MKIINIADSDQPANLEPIARRRAAAALYFPQRPSIRNICAAAVNTEATVGRDQETTQHVYVAQLRLGMTPVSDQVTIVSTAAVKIRSRHIYVWPTIYPSGGALIDRSVVKAILTFYANNITRPYGQTNALTYGASGYVNGENFATSGVTGAPALSCAATPSSLVSQTFPIVIAAGSLASSRYNFGFTNGTLSITQAANSLTVTQDHWPSGDTPLSATTSHQVPGDMLVGQTGLITAVAPFGTVAYSSSNPSIAAIHPTTGVITLIARRNSNFNVAFTVAVAGTPEWQSATIVGGTHAFYLIPPVISFDINDSPIYYGQKLDWLISPDSPANWDIDPPWGTQIKVTTLNVPASVTYTYTPNDSANYDVASGERLLVVLPSSPVMACTPIVITYGQTLAVALANLTVKNQYDATLNAINNGDLVYYVDGSARSLNYVPSAAFGGVFVGIHFTPKLVGGDAMIQYNEQFLPDVAVEVNKAVLTVTPVAASRYYGDNNPAFTYDTTGFVNGDTFGTAVAGNAAISCSIADTTGNAGSYAGAITATVGNLLADNYTFVVVGTANLTITPRPITVTATSTTRPYEDIGVLGYTDNTALVVPYTGALAVDSYLGGQHTITMGTLSAGGNFAVTFITGILTVTQEPVYVYTAETGAHDILEGEQFLTGINRFLASAHDTEWNNITGQGTWEYGFFWEGNYYTPVDFYNTYYPLGIYIVKFTFHPTDAVKYQDNAFSTEMFSIVTTPAPPAWHLDWDFNNITANGYFEAVNGYGELYEGYRHDFAYEASAGYLAKQLQAMRLSNGTAAPPARAALALDAYTSGSLNGANFTAGALPVCIWIIKKYKYY